MRLNHDCVRDVMLFIESDITFGNFLHLEDFLTNEKLKSSYDSDTIKYTLAKLAETNYLKSTPRWMNNDLIMFSTGMITWDGHEFLDTIRDPEVWSNTKKILSHLESVSISTVSNIGTGVLNHIIDKQMGY